MWSRKPPEGGLSARSLGESIHTQDITDDLEAALEQFRMIAEDLNGATAK